MRKSFIAKGGDAVWKPASYNVVIAGEEYGGWQRVLRKDEAALTVLTKRQAPSGKAWKIIGKAPNGGEEVFILEGAYYSVEGRKIADAGDYIFNADGAIHGGYSPGTQLLLVHWCSGVPDDLISAELADFEPSKA